MRWLMLAALVTLSLVLLSGCTKGPGDAPNLARRFSVDTRDMIAFDRAFIPALVLTDAGDDARARKATGLVMSRWQDFYAKYTALQTVNPQWKAELDNLNRLILTADRWLLEGKPAREAHDVLESVRATMKDLRIGYGVEYDLDYLTLFHAPMETIILAVKGKTPETLTEADLALLRNQAGAAQAIWSTLVEKARFDAQLYQLTPEQSQRLHDEITLEAAALDELRAAVAQGDKAAIITTARALKPHFKVIYTLFGDFEAVK